MGDERDVVQSGAIFRMKQADLRWRSPMPMRALKKAPSPAVEHHVPMTPTKIAPADNSPLQRTPNGSSRSAFDSLCLRSPMPKVLLNKLQHSEQKASASKPPRPMSLVTPPTQKKLKIVFKSHSAVKALPADIKAMVAPTSEPHIEDQTVASGVAIDAPKVGKSKAPLALSEQLALLQRQHQMAKNRSVALAAKASATMENEGAPQPNEGTASYTAPQQIAAETKSTPTATDTKSIPSWLLSPQTYETPTKQRASPTKRQASPERVAPRSAKRALLVSPSAREMLAVALPTTPPVAIAVREGATATVLVPRPKTPKATPSTSTTRNSKSAKLGNTPKKAPTSTVNREATKIAAQRNPGAGSDGLDGTGHLTPLLTALDSHINAHPLSDGDKHDAGAARELRNLTTTFPPTTIATSATSVAILAGSGNSAETTIKTDAKAKAISVEATPVEAIPAQTAPSHVEVTSAQPMVARAKRMKTASVKDTPAKSTTAKGTPVKGTPAKSTTTKGTPVKGTPAKSTTTKATLSKQKALKVTSAKARKTPSKVTSAKTATPAKLATPASSSKASLGRLRKSATPAKSSSPSSDSDALPMIREDDPKDVLPPPQAEPIASPEAIEIQGSDPEQPFELKDARIPRLAKHFSFEDASSDDDDNADAALADRDADTSLIDDEDETQTRRISDEFAAEIKTFDESDLVIEEKQLQLHNWSVVWPPRIKSATNVFLSIRGSTGLDDDHVVKVTFKAHRTARQFLSTDDEEVHLVGPIAAKAPLLPAVRAYFKNGIPRQWRTKVDSLLLDAYGRATSSGVERPPCRAAHTDGKKAKAAKPVINSLGSFLDSESSSSDGSSDEDESSSEGDILNLSRDQLSAQRSNLQSPRPSDDEAPKVTKKRKAPFAAWSGVQLGQLKQAIQLLPPNVPDYWNKVARAVEGKMGDECQAKHFEGLASGKKAKAAPVIEFAAQKLSRAGTIKRKMQMRQFVQEVESKTADDVYHSPPQRPTPSQTFDALESPKSNKKLKPIARYHRETSASDDSDGSSSSEAPFSPVTMAKRHGADSYMSHLNKQAKVGLKPTALRGPAATDARTTVAMETKVGSRSLVGTMTPNGTTRLRISRDSDASDSIEISYDLEASDASDSDDGEASEYEAGDE
ncbi:hypothetical protein ACHHYP_05102 [Achlya hypogyna]|uniref:Myb-like domain-containing protein n=1 Tax=Achlya hypogyna TaxID=1202772 RepID=A0A1V9YZ45_ACHHY|nr:hypothetical protein ACHHYP_05102 [Achlya hypogyna]